MQDTQSEVLTFAQDSGGIEEIQYSSKFKQTFPECTKLL